MKELLELRLKSPTESPGTSRSVTPTVQISTSAAESGCSTPTPVPAAQPPPDAEVLVNTALLDGVEDLEGENSHLNENPENKCTVMALTCIRELRVRIKGGGPNWK